MDGRTQFWLFNDLLIKQKDKRLFDRVITLAVLFRNKLNKKSPAIAGLFLFKLLR
ncbi:MAG: hypothetical protein ACJAUR_001715 [Ulvibacter sp.]|jgi:hypothetical protein